MTQYELQDQHNQWSRAAARYDELFLDAFDGAAVNPLLAHLEQIPDRGNKTVADLGCGTGPLLPLLVGPLGFGRVLAFDFATSMIQKARSRLGEQSGRVEFHERYMHELDEFAGQLDVAVAVNSVVMPDVRLIDQTLRAIRAALRPEGVFLGVVPSIDAIHYHTMLLMDQALDTGATPEQAERYAAFHAEHALYDFAFGRFTFQGLKQKFWQPFELRHRLTKAGFTEVGLSQLLYPWDDSLPRGNELSQHPQSWDWTFTARP